jgi:phosphoribosylanthranilate isomerase
MFLKVCGITREEDAQAAARLGFDAIGLIFAESPRRVDPDQARAIARSVPAGLTRVGVFVNQERREVERLMEYCGLDLVQLHGEEDASYVAHFAGRAIKSFAPGPDFDDAMLENFTGCFALLLDARDPLLRGGSGRLSDWEAAARLAHKHPVILAGGLTPSLVARAILAVRPFGLDVSSGVEITPGIKDPEMMRYFLEAARSVSSLPEVR